MRDPERIPKILKEIERIWTTNPDFRLGQLLMVATRPSSPCPDIFYVEDDKIIAGLQLFEERMILNRVDVK